MKALALLLLAVAVSQAFLPHEHLAFKKWMSEHNKTYKDQDEYNYRLGVYLKNAEFVHKHNQSGKTFTVALNKFADLTNEEFRDFYLGYNKAHRSTLPADRPKTRDHVFLSEADPSAPATWDWRQKNAVTHVKNQEQCGSCWSFSTTGSTEGCHAIKTGNLVSLSEQNLMDCSDSYGNQGCEGGLMVWAYEYIIANKGIDTEQSYPYTAEDGYQCNYRASKSGATLSNYVNVTSGDENGLLSQANIGPVSVAIDASQDSFQFYSSGVYSDSGCGNGPDDLDHGVLVVGWGTYQGTAYWLVKNSWGEDWGLEGYIMMARNDGNMCGIATDASRPTC